MPTTSHRATIEFFFFFFWKKHSTYKELADFLRFIEAVTQASRQWALHERHSPVYLFESQFRTTPAW